jgi:putative nucleotidyltransferase with HDIG domain
MMDTPMEVQHQTHLPPPDDPVLLHLSQALAHYRDVQIARERQAALLHEVETQLGLEQARNAYLTQENTDLHEQFTSAQAHITSLSQENATLLTRLAALETRAATLEQENQSLQNQFAPLQAQNASLAQERQALQAQVDQERERAERNRRLSEKLAAAMRDLHMALFSRNNLHELILRTCMMLTGATCGLYIVQPNQRSFRVRAAIGVDGYPQSQPSEFIKALAHKVLEQNDTVVCNEETDLSQLPAPASPAEQFENCIVAPVVILKNFSGIVIVANKETGEFREEDVEVLLSVGDQAAVAVENEQLQEELQQAYLSIVGVLADAAEAKDPYTHGHCELVSRYARLVANRLDLDDEARSTVCFAALLHDIGKIGVSDGILHKVGRLLPEERDLIRSHVRIGYELLAKVPALQEVAHVVLYHHEWYDGSGYPNGLKGDAIPLAARIVSVVDAYCAMITRRSYKEEYSAQRAREELVQYAGTQFDPTVVQIFLQILDTPEAQDDDPDYAAECGMLPGYGRAKRQLEEEALG